MEIFTVKKATVKGFLNDEFEYSDCDWYTGEKWLVKLKDSIKYSNYLKRINRKKNVLILCIISVFFNLNILQ